MMEYAVPQHSGGFVRRRPHGGTFCGEAADEES
jgi:hypothetical protein